MNATYRQSLHADYLPKDLSLIIIHVYKLSSPEDGPARDGAYIMSKQTTLFMWIRTCIYSCSPHTHTHIHLQNTQRSLCLRGPDIYEDASSMALWQHYAFLAAASPLIRPLSRPTSALLKKACLHKPRGRCGKKPWPSRSCSASRHREALVHSQAIWTTASSVCVRMYNEAGCRIRE